MGNVFKGKDVQLLIDGKPIDSLAEADWHEPASVSTCTRRIVSVTLVQMMHQSRHAEQMHFEALRAAIAAGHFVVHDEIAMDIETQRKAETGRKKGPRRLFDHFCGRCGTGWNIGGRCRCKGRK